MTVLELHPLDAIALSQLPEPDAAAEFLRYLRTGRREAVSAQMSGLRLRDVNRWRKDVAAFDEACIEAYQAGTATLDDAARVHIINAESGWAGALKTILQQRDDSYSDKQKIEREDTVKLVEVHREQPPEEWEGGK